MHHVSRRKTWAILVLKLAIVALVLWFVGDTLIKGMLKLREYDWDFSYSWLAIAGAIYLVGLLPAGLFWWHVLRVLGQKTSLVETIRAYTVGHLGKYVPGKAMVVVLRAGLLPQGRTMASVAAAAVFYETLTMMAVGAVWAAASLAVGFRQHWVLCATAIGLMSAAGIPTLPPLFRRLARLARVARSDPATQRRLDRIGYQTLAIGWLMMTLCWVLLAASLWATLKAMGIEGIDLVADMPRYMASVALAMVAGFLSLIPGGLLVRDMILAELMVPYFVQIHTRLDPQAAAVLSALVLRLVWLVAELAASGVVYFGFRPRNPAAAN